MWLFNIVNLFCYWFSINNDFYDLDLRSFIKKSKVIWTKAGKQVFPRRRIQFNENGSLIIFGISLNDRGIYNLTLLSSEYTKTFLLELVVPDNRLELRTASKIYVNEGSNISIEVKAKTYGKSEWNFRNNLDEKSALQLVNVDESNNINGSIFKIKHVSLKHEGFYEYVYKVDQCSSRIEVEVIVLTGQVVDFWKCIRSRYKDNAVLLLSFLILAFWVHHREIGLRELAKEKKTSYKEIILS